MGVMKCSERELREFKGIFKGCYGGLSKSSTKGIIGCQGSHQVGVKTVNSPKGINFSLRGVRKNIT